MRNGNKPKASRGRHSDDDRFAKSTEARAVQWTLMKKQIS